MLNIYNTDLAEYDKEIDNTLKDMMFDWAE